MKKLSQLLSYLIARLKALIAWLQAQATETAVTPPGQTQFPYHLREYFLSPAELNFYRVLHTAVADWAVIAPKVRLGDLFYAQTGSSTQNRIYRNKINAKHVDFLLCDPHGLHPILAIELDDKSHERPERQQRDRFVDSVFAAAGLPLVHIPVRPGYPVARLAQDLRRQAGMGNPHLSADA